MAQQVPVYEKVERSVGAQVPTPTKSEFKLRLLLHVDNTGQARLLKEVVQMWRDGTYTNDASGQASGGQAWHVRAADGGRAIKPV